MAKIFWLFLIVFSSFNSWASEDFIERVYEGVSDNPNMNRAKQEIFKKATAAVSKDLVIEYIGSEKFQRNSVLIRDRIIKQYSKFIPFIKPSPARVQGEKIYVTVNMRVSLNNLQKMLLQNGLLYEDDGAPVVVPMIQFIDRTKLQSMKWWVNSIENEKTSRFLSSVFDKMRDQFFKRGFYLYNPINSQMSALIPLQYRFDRPRVKDWQTYGQIFKAQIVVFGSIEVSQVSSRRIKTVVRFSAIQTANGRVIAGVTRTFESNAGPFALAESMIKWAPKVSADLSIQILEAWQRGTFGARLLTLKINKKLNYSQLKAFKQKLKATSKSIKSIKDRFFDPNFIKVEIDVTKPPSQLVSLLDEFEFEGLRTEVESYDSNSIVLNVK